MRVASGTAMAFTAGDALVVRGERWIVEDSTAFAECTVLQLAHGVGRRARRCRVLLPFDRPIPIPRTPRIRPVTKRQWAFRLRAQVSSIRVFGRLRAAEHAAIDILPFQLEPALALLHGSASRFLLADEVGLGKTIQAGLMLAELQHRGWCERALIITPSGLRQQWAEELQHRFDIGATVFDAASLSARAAQLPLDVNPWTVESVAITSVDFVKQPEVLRALAQVVWDVVVVDEAHQAALGSQRHEAVAILASRARHLILLTATPHGGDEQAYRALCALGRSRPDEPMLRFRRTREQTGIPTRRRAHLLRVTLSEAELRMHRLLDAYVSRVWSIAQTTGAHDLRLVAMVLAKRAISSAASLAASLQRRLDGLERNDPPAGAQSAQADQPALPFEDAADDAIVPNTPAFDRSHEERGVLERLLDAARIAANEESKLRAMVRMLRRAQEPAIVFTEYRDTLRTIASAVGPLRRIATVHGGLSPQERRASVAAFTSGDADLLVATDAGSEGLNLHTRCRLVINLELPWNPIRLEQRVGRVDRIGQARTVHAVNLLASGTAEATVLSALCRRLARIRMSEIEMAACLIGHAEPASAPRDEPELCTTVDLRSQATDEAQRIAQSRIHVQAAVVRRPGIATCLVHMPPASVIAFLRIRLRSGGGRLVEDTLLPLRIPARMAIRNPSRRHVRAVAEDFVATTQPALLDIARAHMLRRARAIEAALSGAAQTAMSRERWIAARLWSEARRVQPGLFDNRPLDGHRDVQMRQLHGDTPRPDASVEISGDPEIALLLFTC